MKLEINKSNKGENMNVLTKLSLGLLLAFSISCAQNTKKNETKVKAPAKKTMVAKADAKSAEAILCNVGNDKRLVTVDKTILDDNKTKRCEVNYTKWGETSQVAWAQATQSLCGDVVENIKTNIEAKGFQCKEINPDEHKTASLDK